MRGPSCYQAMYKLIIVKSMVGTILCLCALCNYTEVQNVQCTIICSICDYNFKFINLRQFQQQQYLCEDKEYWSGCSWPFCQIVHIDRWQCLWITVGCLSGQKPDAMCFGKFGVLRRATELGEGSCSWSLLTLLTSQVKILESQKSYVSGWKRSALTF